MLVDIISISDFIYLAQTILGEAEGEGDATMLAVAQVIDNRRRRHPSRSYRVVVTAPDQFSCWSNSSRRDAMLDPGENPLRYKAWLRCLQAASRVATASPIVLTPELEGVTNYVDISLADHLPDWGTPLSLPGVPHLIFFEHTEV